MRIANVNMVYLGSVKHMSEELTLQILMSVLFTCLFITWGNFFIELSFEFWNSMSGALEMLIHSLSHWGIHQSDVFTQNAEGLCAPTRIWVSGSMDQIRWFFGGLKSWVFEVRRKWRIVGKNHLSERDYEEV